MLARVFPSVLTLAIVAGSAQAQTIRVVPAPANTFVLIGFDAFNGGGAVGSATGAFGSSGLISRPASTIAVAPPAGSTSLAFQSASATGSVLTGSLDTGFAVRYTTATGVTSIGGLPTHNASEAARISSDGTTIVGTSRNTAVANSQTAFRWTSGGMTSLGRLPGATTSEATAVSGNGSVVVGTSGNQAFRWTEADGIQPLTAPSASLRLARAVSGDGNTVWGLTDSNQPFRWTPAGTTLLPAGTGLTQVLDVSDDGSTAVGATTIGSSVSAVAWFGSQMYNLNTWAPAQGIDLQGWRLALALGVSSDGRTIAVTGEKANQSGIIVINLPQALPLLIPAPGSVALLAGAGLLAARRRRR